MNHSVRQLTAALRMATLAFAVVGVWALLAPASGSAVSVPDIGSPGGDSSGSTPAPEPDLEAADRVVASDIFSARRSPPAERSFFGEPAGAGTPDESGGESVPGGSIVSDSVMADGDDAVVPHLYGTMRGPSGGSALLRLDAAIAEPRLYRAGDRAGGYRLESIGDRSVVLDGPSGRVVLRLGGPNR